MNFFKKEKLFWNTLNYFEYLKFFFHGSSKRFLEIIRQFFNSENIFFTSSGRGAINIGLKVLDLKKNDQVFIPPFLSSCIIDSITSIATPSLEFNKNTKAIILYHHWGYMQDIYAIKEYIKMKEIFVIEDCAYTFWAKYGEYDAGSFGDLSSFSLSKIFRITYCGLLKINRHNLVNEVKKILSKEISLIERFEHLKGTFTYLNYYSKPINKRNGYAENLSLLKWYAYLLSSPNFKNIRGEIPRNNKELKLIFKDMNEKFKFFLNQIENREFILDKDDVSKMAPICYPYISENISLLNQIKLWLTKYNIFVDIYNFDVNRNMFNSNYKKCIPLPLYDGIDINIYKKLFIDFPEIK